MSIPAREELLGAVVAAVPVGIAVVDRDHVVRMWNDAAARIFGWTADEVIGRRYPVVPDDSMAEFAERCALAFAGQGFQRFETRRRRNRSLGSSNAHVPVAALTARARTEDRDRALAAGYDMHIAKPVGPPELCRAVAKLAGQTSQPNTR